ncbi:MAG: peptidase [Oscillochloris sp.]|nr:peptidase [Oscillochloris sp.]
MALRPRVGPVEVDHLLALVAAGPDSRVRRNALRVLGRVADSPRGSRAYEVTRRARGAAFRETLRVTLQHERDPYALQDAIWLLDSFFFPSDHSAADLERIAADESADPLLRYRAARARARLIFPPLSPLTSNEQAFIRSGLASDAAGVRAAAAEAIARLRDVRLTAELRAELRAWLAQAALAEPPLQLPPAAPDPRGSAGLISGSLERPPGLLAARAAIARAEDRLDGGDHVARLRQEYENLALPYLIEQGVITLRGGLPEVELWILLARVEQTIDLFAQIVGSELNRPMPGEERPLRVLIFPTQESFHDYLLAFTNLSGTIDGVYIESEATIYTSARRPDQSEHRLEVSVQHEVAHHLTATRLFPGAWKTPGYHGEPKGWADEGLAELLAGAVPDGAGGLRPALQPIKLERLCALSLPPDLNTLLTQRDGYDRYGRFDYDSAWALTYFMYVEHPQALRDLYRSFRSGAYRSAEWPRIAGIADRTAFEAAWHAALAGWCAAR